MARCDGRKIDELRPVAFTVNYLKHPPGSCLVETGGTRVICSASVEDSVPHFLKGRGMGWVTAEYGMLPGSTNTRVSREKASTSGRTMEIQRLIGRSLRGVVNRTALGERTIKIDCDVLQADGGTRVAAINGGFVALALALRTLKELGVLTVSPLLDTVAAVSVGILDDEILLDLNCEEDAHAQTDMNVVALGRGGFLEVQGTAEKNAFSRAQLDGLLSVAEKGLREISRFQAQALGA
jgi:ribonuclease PH